MTETNTAMRWYVVHAYSGFEKSVQRALEELPETFRLPVLLADVEGFTYREIAEMLDIPIGTMIEVPRAAVTAHRIARAADFFSFGTNDLTQTTWAFSRDDVEASFVGEYLERGIFGTSPFESIDPYGVGELVKIAIERGRSVKSDIGLGVCGEHGGDPTSIHFFDEVGLDYVSCSPFRVPVARLEAGRASLSTTHLSDTR